MTKCKKCEFIFVKKLKSNGDFLVQKQCFECGKKSPKTAYKFDEVGGIDKVKKLPDFNYELENKYYEMQRIEAREKYLAKRDELLTEYSIYLNSEKWKEKRERVLKRDNYVCKACERNKATQVHHISYEFIYNEPLFDLVSVCKPCHDKIERIKKENKGIV